MRARSAFTLIEVMAAVFMLGLFVAAISQLLTQARRNEGFARLQAQAAAQADDEVASLEEGLARGTAPALGSRESGEDPWRVVTEVRPFDVTLLAPAAPEAQRAAPAAAGAASLLAAPSARETPPLLEIEVRVSWEGAPADSATGEPFAIRRRTFALNPAALEALPGAEAGGAGDEGGEE
jgi:prepilin-type N-terminal cleavage/methylation domain-containing protein